MHMYMWLQDVSVRCVACVELINRRGIGPRGVDVVVADDVDLKETIKVFLLTNITRTIPLHVTMQTTTHANNRYDFLKFILECLRDGHLVSGDVLVLVNAPIHNARDIAPVLATLAAAFGITVCFLPAYSPELNPSELVFAQSKHYLRYHRRMHYPFWYEVARAFSETSNQNMMGYYYECIWKI
jgi:transposase